jgi:hypothetical protein
MTCSGINLVKNGDFQQGLNFWSGTGVILANHIVRRGNVSALLKKGSVLRQQQRIQAEKGCAYYLYFRLFNVTPASLQAKLFATVTYLDEQDRILRTTPLEVQPHINRKNQFQSFFNIVPPPPSATRKFSIKISVEAGVIFLDYIRFSSHVVEGAG